jgi:hypothetical protein
MNPQPETWIPGPAERAARNAALHTTGAETGFWDDHGRPAPWPDDIDEWRPATTKPNSPEPEEQPF